MQWGGWIALIVLLLYSSYPSKIRKLERNVKKLAKKQKGDNTMSKIINELVGKTCKIQSEEDANIKCTIIDTDDEWIKIRHTQGKNIDSIKLIRVDSIKNIELISE